MWRQKNKQNKESCLLHAAEELNVGVPTKVIEFNKTVIGEYFVTSFSPKECLNYENEEKNISIFIYIIKIE